jgi:hypothetical protein
LVKGFVVSKARSVEQHGRYIIVDQPVKMIRTSRNAAFPYSFSLDEAEAYLARQSDLTVVSHSSIVPNDTPINRLTPRSVHVPRPISATRVASIFGDAIRQHS